ncbi:hypothetical protein [Psychrobacillus sp. BM2]
MKKYIKIFMLSIALIIMVSSVNVLADDKDIPDPSRSLEIQD